MELRVKFFSCAAAYAPNSILQCFLKSMVVPVMSVHGEIVQEMLLFTGSALIQKMAFSTMQEIIMFGNFGSRASSMYCGSVPSPHLFVSKFVAHVHQLR